VASEAGGLAEAKRGAGYLIPVKMIERYEPVYDEHAMPLPVVEAHDPAPWIAALRELLTDRAAYERESLASKAAAERFVGGLDAAEMELYLKSLQPAGGAEDRATVESLSPEKRALLLERLRKRRTGT
jgi:hypothetical protein